MSKVIDYKNIWYQEVAPRSYYGEEDLERAIMQNLEIIFPQFQALSFKKKLFDPVRGKNNTPDLAIVKRDYSEWYIIEVELGKHDKDHVVDQVTTFYNCGYTDDHADYIFNKRPKDFDLKQLKRMIGKVVPDFMVIVNEQKSEWIADLKKLNCKTCLFQIFHDYNGNSLYRLNGEHPYIYTNFCHCKYQKNGVPYAVEVLDKQFLDSYSINAVDLVDIEYNGLRSQWERLDDSKRIFLLSKNSRPPLEPLNDKYRLNYNDLLRTFTFTKD